MALNPASWLEGLRKIDRVLALEENHGKILRRQAEEIQELKDRLTKLEAQVQAREEIRVAEAKGAAVSVASAIASQYIAALAQSIGRIEARMEALQGRLPRPLGDV